VPAEIVAGAIAVSSDAGAQTLEFLDQLLSRA